MTILASRYYQRALLAEVKAARLQKAVMTRNWFMHGNRVEVLSDVEAYNQARRMVLAKMHSTSAPQETTH